MVGTKKITSLGVCLAVPVLFSVYPVVFLYAHNVSILTLSQLPVPLVFASILAGIVFFLLQGILKVATKASLAAALFMVLFWNYNLLPGGLARAFGPVPWVLLFLSLSLYALLVWGIHRVRKIAVLKSCNHILLVVISVLLVFNLIGMMRAEIRKSQIASPLSDSQSLRVKHVVPDNLPDIYFIILDEYANFHTLKEAFDYDNDAFAAFLRRKGFFIAENSRSRYITTALSLAAMLNLDYPTDPVDPDVMLDLIYRPETLQGTDVYAEYQEHDQMEVFERWRNNFLFEFLTAHQYNIDVLEGVSQHYSRLDFPRADTHIAYQNVGAIGAALWGRNHFYVMLLRSSLLSPLLDSLGWEQIDDVHYLGTKYVLGRLKERRDASYPRFVYAHIMSPHAPYVFDRYGNYVQQSTDALRGRRVDGMVTAANTAVNEAYVEQLAFITSEITDVIAHHFKNGMPTNTIFLIMSDHGPRPHELYLEDPHHAFHILHAVYFPDGDYSGLYDAISPVNTMRVMLNQFFGKDYPMLIDR